MENDLRTGLVIIPTFNEKENIQRILEAVMALDPLFDVLVVDDGSPDGTADVVRQVMATYPERIYLKERAGKSGLGTAYIEGFRWGLERHYDLFFEMDADFSHNPADLLRLRQPVADGEADVTVGSRYIKGGQLENWPADRIMLSRGASFYVQMITWMPVHDPTAGFVCYHRRVLEAIDLNRIRFVGYAFQIEMKFASWTLGFRIKEVPILFADRIEGVSKMSKAIVREAIGGVIEMKWRSLFQSYQRH
ncbi:MAG: polyprenol monophosphomannose synthase [Lewinellaceae bacterium]|nr:polyprenol monophosphomannose synthase [Saprospiraceae bacterium]MCB9311272.1 polyprenol monophosphomannose synthase [Lewinellaceae bacterium]HRW74888.1 polyprenol monophosphomannose synthase [Saprospiraceae bacterium]